MRYGIILATALAAELLACGPRGAAAQTPAAQTPAAQAPAASDDDTMRRGEYVARLGDCIACHTGASGVPYAGGVPFQWPGGTVYSSNITPDRQNGIGNLTEEQFARVVREGIGPDGKAISPTMPYPSFSRITDEDMKLLYAFFMKGIPPSTIASKPPETKPGIDVAAFNEAWRKENAPPLEAFDPKRYADAKVARGAYIVQGLGHCGDCHSPRAENFKELAETEYEKDGVKFLAGGAIYAGWSPLSIRNDANHALARMSEDELAELLRTGRNHATATFGIMNLIVRESTQYMSEDDLKAVAAYLKTLGKAPEGGWQYDNATTEALQRGDEKARGAAVYLDNCNACHRSDGKGWERVFPALAGNPVLLDPEPTGIIRIVLFGSTLPGLKTAPSPFTMAPAAGRLTDAQVADVVSFVRAGWGNKAAAVTAADVEKVRKQEFPSDRALWESLAPPSRNAPPAPPAPGSLRAITAQGKPAAAPKPN